MFFAKCTLRMEPRDGSNRSKTQRYKRTQRARCNNCFDVNALLPVPKLRQVPQIVFPSMRNLGL